MSLDPNSSAYLTSSLFCLILSSFVLGRHEKSPTRDAFLLQVVFSFILQFGNFFVMTAPSVEVATLISRFSYIGCIFLPIASYQLSVNYLSLTSQRKFVELAYWYGALLFLPLLLTDHLLETVYQYSWGFWYHAGKFHPIHLFFFAIFGLASLINLFIYGQRMPDKAEKNKCQLLFWAYFLSYFGVIDFLPYYGYDILPFGLLFLNILLLTIWFIIKFYDFLYVWVKVISYKNTD
jgi:hypothetical protein